MRLISRRKFRFSTIRAGAVIKKGIAITAAAVAVRFLFGAGILENAEKLLMQTANDPDFIKTALMMELGSLNSNETDIASDDPLVKKAVTLDSAVFLAYDKILNEDTAEENSVIFIPYIENESSVSPPPIPSPTPVPSPSVTPTPSPSVLPQDAPTISSGGFPIEAITINPTEPYGYEYFDGVYINNAAGVDIDAEAMVGTSSALSLNDKGAQVLIVHTHGSEAYTPAGEDIYEPTDIERTEDINFNVVRVGDEIEQILTEKGINVLHDRNIYDYPSYNGAYTRTLEAINTQLEANPSIKIVIDVHRDSMTAKDGTVYKTVTDINGEQAAQVMFVMGTNKGGLSHNNWKKNLTLAVEIQKNMVNNYPGLARPINLRKERFNQHATTGSMLVEIGTAGNTLREALAGARLFAEATGDVLLNYKK